MSEALQGQLKGVSAQLEAAKQMVNEGMQVNLQLKTNLVLFQQAYNEVVEAKKVLEDKVLELTPKSDEDAS